MTNTNILKERETDCKNRYAIKATENGYSLTEKASYLSDSCNPQGEWAVYESEIRSYRTRGNAVKALKKIIAQQFPVGYNLDELFTSLFIA